MLSSDRFLCCLGIVVRQYKNSQMLVAIRALNNITAHKLFIDCCGMLSDSYYHQTTNNFKKLLNQQDMENTLIITVPILMVLRMHIGLTRLLENDASNAKFDIYGRLYPGSTGFDWDNSTKIKDAIGADKDDKDEEKNSQERNKQLKRQKQYQKRATKVKTCSKTCQQADQDADNKQNIDNDQDINYLALSAAFLGLSAPGAPSFGFFAPTITSFGYLASATPFFYPLTPYATPPALQTMAFFLFFYVFFFVFVCLFFLLFTLLDPLVTSTMILKLTLAILLPSPPL